VVRNEATRIEQMDTKQVVRGYFEAWTSKDMGKARGYLADDLDFQGPIDRFTNADDFLRALGGFAQMLSKAQLLAEFYAGEEAMLLYDCVTPTPAGTLRTAEHFTVTGGKIRRIRLVFDATALRPLMATRT
jgi:hypothetical protein